MAGYIAYGKLGQGLHTPLVIQPGPKVEVPAERLRLVKHEVSRDGDGYRISATVAPRDPKRPLAGVRFRPDYKQDANRWAAKVAAKAADDVPILLDWSRDADYPQHTGKWLAAAMPGEGVTISTSFRKASQFDTRRIKSLTLAVLTDGGVEEFDVSAGFTESLPPETPFGPEVGGVKLRIRPAEPVFSTGEPARFYVQAVNVREKPVVWWSNHSVKGQFSENVTIEIDDKPLDVPKRKAEYVSGWAADHTCRTPEEWWFELPAALVPTVKGRHTLVLKESSKPGNYSNSLGQKVPLLDGTLVSNEVTFEIK